MNAIKHKTAGRRLPRILLCSVALLTAVTASASANTFDMDGDRNLTAFDVVLKKREALAQPDSAAIEDVYRLDSHLLGFHALGLNDDPPVQWLLEPEGTVHSGDATYYSGGYSSGRASLAPVPEGFFVTAINQTDYHDAMLAGAYLRVTAANGKSVDVYVTDTSSQTQGHLDLNTSAFTQLAPTSTGRLQITWTIIPLPTDAPMTFLFSSDSSASWFSMQVRGHVYPIYSITRIASDGTETVLPRRTDNYFVGTGAGAGPFTFRLTDIYGHSVTETVPLSPGSAVLGSTNFPVTAAQGTLADF